MMPLLTMLSMIGVAAASAAAASVLLAGLERQGRFADGAAQLRGQRVVAGTMHGRLSGRFFRRFRIRQAQDSSKV